MEELVAWFGRSGTICDEKPPMEDILDEDDHSNQSNQCNRENQRPVCLVMLPDVIMAKIASFLEVGSLKRARLVNRNFNRILSSDEAGWVNHCHRLWSRRFHAHPEAYQHNTAKDAYRLSCIDARLRHYIKPEEFIFDPKNATASTVWSFRFKEAAGIDWIGHDPWYDGRPARQFVFLASGEVRQFVALSPDNQLDYALRPAFCDAANLPGGLDIRWRFVTQPLDFPKKEEGAYVRLTISGRDIPTYIVHRSPNSNWGFLCENCWGVFASFTLPRKVHVQPIVRPPRMRLRRDTTGRAHWVDTSRGPLAESDEEEECHADTMASIRLLDDSIMTVGCNWQWREALLYNLGTAILPDGPNALEEFNRAWNRALQTMQGFGFPAAPAPNGTAPPRGAQP